MIALAFKIIKNTFCRWISYFLIRPFHESQIPSEYVAVIVKEFFFCFIGGSTSFVIATTPEEHTGN